MRQTVRHDGPDVTRNALPPEDMVWFASDQPPGPSGAPVVPWGPEDAPARGGLRRRLRFGLGFSLAISLTFHSSLLAMFVMGTAPGSADGKEGIAVEIITQEQLDAMLGNGSSEGGHPPKVDDTDTGTEATQRTQAASAPRPSQSKSDQSEAQQVIGAQTSVEQARVGTSDRINAAASDAPRQSSAKAPDKGSDTEARAMHRTDPKVEPRKEREDARTEAEPAQVRPGSEGGEMRRVASRGTVGEQQGPLPPTMRQTLMHLLQKQIELCYVPPKGVTASPALPLILLRLHRDGSLDGVPKSLRYEATPAMRSLSKAAVKAVRQCAPYRMPPRYAPYYEDWREIRAEFEFASR